MTRIRYEPGKFRLTIRGHAGAGARGADIVCAGLSALGFALVDAAEARGGKVRRDKRAALIDARLYPRDAASAIACRAVLETVAGGLRRIAGAWPEYVKFEEDDSVHEQHHLL